MSRIKYFETITNSRGDSLANYRVQVVDSAGAIVMIYQDEAGTRFQDAAGNVVNFTLAGPAGKAEFWWEPASGQILQVLDAAGNLVDATDGFANKYVLTNLPGNIATAAVDGLDTSLAAKAESAALASPDPDKGAALVGTKRANVTGSVPREVNRVLWEKPITPFDKGAVMDARMTGASANNSGAVDPNSTDDTDAFEAFLFELAATGRPGELWPRDENFDPANPPGMRLSRTITVPSGRNNISLKGPGRELFKIIQTANFDSPLLVFDAEFDHLRADIRDFTVTRTDPGPGGQGVANAPAISIRNYHSFTLDGIRTNRMGCGIQILGSLGGNIDNCLSWYDRYGIRLDWTSDYTTTPNLISINDTQLIASYEIGLYAFRPTKLRARNFGIEQTAVENPNWAADGNGVLIQDACHAGHEAVDLDFYMEGVKGYGVQIIDRRDKETYYKMKGTINRVHEDQLADILINMASHQAGDPVTTLVNECQHGTVIPGYTPSAARPYLAANPAAAYKNFTLRDERAMYRDAAERPVLGTNVTRPRPGGDFNAYVPNASTNGVGIEVVKQNAGIYRIFPARGWNRETVNIRLVSGTNTQGLVPRLSGETADYVEYTWEVYNGTAWVTSDAAFWVSGTYL